MKIKVLDVRRPILPGIRDQYEVIPGRAGSYLFSQPFADRLIEVDCVLVSENSDNVWQDIRSVSAWLTSNKKEHLVLSTEPNVYYMAKASNSMDVEQILYVGQFTIQFTCEPFAYSLEDIIIQFTALSNTSYGVYNNGTAETSPTITITAAYGDIINPKIMINDIVFLYNGTITVNSQIDINSGAFTSYKGMNRDINTTGAYDPAEDSILALIDGEFPMLQPGPNSFVYSSDNGAQADIKVQFKERWI